MNHQALAIDWIDNPFQNLHPRLFNKQRKVANKRKKEPGTTLHSLSELNLTRDCSLVRAEHWSRGGMKRGENLVKSRFADEQDAGLTHPGRTGRFKQTPRDQPFFPPLDVRPCHEKTALRRHNSSGVLPTTQRGNYTAAALSKRYSFQERRIDRTLKTQQNRLDSQESLLSAYSSCLSLNQDVQAAKAPTKTGSFKGYSSPFVIGTRASNPNLFADDFCYRTGNPRHHVISTSPTRVKRQASISQRELRDEVIMKPKLHRSYSGHRKWSAESAKRFYSERDF